MTRKDLVDNLQEQLEDYSRKDLEYAVKIIFDSIKSAMAKGERVEIRGFGNFTVRTRNSRMGRNPRTGESVYIVKKKVSFFKAGKELKKMVDYTS
jgi:integration host factor subunit beta